MSTCWSTCKYIINIFLCMRVRHLHSDMCIHKHIYIYTHTQYMLMHIYSVYTLRYIFARCMRQFMYVSFRISYRSMSTECKAASVWSCSRKTSIHIPIHTYIFIHTHAHIYTHTRYTHIYTYIHPQMYTYMNVHRKPSDFDVHSHS